MKRCAVVLLFLMSSLFPLAVQAEDDPFQLESTHWMSFDRYKDKIKHGDVTTQETTENPTTASDTAQAGDAKDGASITPPTLATAIAAPTRAVHIPVMPGMNKGYKVEVNSTEDEKTPVAQITHIDTQPTMQIPERNWQTPQEAAHKLGQSEDGDGDGDNEHQTLDVRMSFLPNTQITPVPSPEYKSSHGRKTAAPAVAAAKEPAPEKKAADLAACAAVDAYKKKQLAAIESDRETLTELQKAIAQLGLQKELSFMAGANGSMNEAPSITAKMDMPPTLASPAKN